MGQDRRQRNGLGAVKGIPARDDGAEGEWGRCGQRVDGVGTCWGRRERERRWRDRGEIHKKRKERDRNVQRTGEFTGDKESREKTRQMERGRERSPPMQRK